MDQVEAWELCCLCALALPPCVSICSHWVGLGVGVGEVNRSQP